MNTIAGRPNGAAIGWKTQRSTIAYETPWFSVRRDDVTFPGGETGVYSYVEHPGSVIIIPMTGEGRVVLLRSYRYPLDRFCWELPAGGLEPGVSVEAAAERELDEEVGCTFNSIRTIGRLFIGNGFARCEAHILIATGVVFNREPTREPGESIVAVDVVDTEEAIDRLTAAEQDGESALAMLFAARQLAKSGASA